MKKIFAIILSLTFVLTLIGCNNRSMDYIIENEPSIVGIVEEVYDNSIIIYVENDSYPNGANCEFLWMWRIRTALRMYLWVMRLLYITMVKSQKRSVNSQYGICISH